MRPEKSEDEGGGGLLAELSEYAVGNRISTITAVARLMQDGFTMTDAAAVLSLPYNEVVRAMADPRAGIVKRRVAVEKSGPDLLAAAQAAFRLERAWEVVTAAMDDADKWARLQAANMVIAADRAAKDKGPQRIEIVMSPAMMFDDQKLQDDDTEDAETDDFALDDGIGAELTDFSMQNEG